MDMLAYFLGRLAGGGTGGAGGTSYKSITYNDDDTITLIGTDDVTHTMACIYVDGALTSVNYDGTEIAIGYENNKLIVGNTVIDLSYGPYTQPKMVEYTTSATMVSPTISGFTSILVKESE